LFSYGSADVIAMQKVVGSNPFSRFSANPPARGRVGFGAGRRNQMEPFQHIAVIPGTNARECLELLGMRAD
jgi:hypothetical protein